LCGNFDCRHVDNGNGSRAVDIVDRKYLWKSYYSKESLLKFGPQKAAKLLNEQANYWLDQGALYKQYGLESGGDWFGRDGKKHYPYIPSVGWDPAHGQLKNQRGQTQQNRILQETNMIFYGVNKE